MRKKREAAMPTSSRHGQARTLAAASLAVTWKRTGAPAPPTYAMNIWAIFCAVAARRYELAPPHAIEIDHHPPLKKDAP